MCANKADINHAIRLVDFYDKPVIVAFDVKYHAVISNDKALRD
jgi:hypothetical protein